MEQRRTPRHAATLFAAAFFAAAPSQEAGKGEGEHTPRTPVELGDVSFARGVEELNLRALYEEREYAVFYVVREGETEGQWVSFQRGARDSITTDRQAAREEIAAVLQSGETRDVQWARETPRAPRARVCYFHTHPLDALVEKGYVSPADARAARAGATHVSMPPSWYDLFLAAGTPALQRSFLAPLEAETGYRIAYEGGVVDPAGVFYYRAYTAEGLKRDYPDAYVQLKELGDALARWRKNVRAVLRTYSKEEVAHLRALMEEEGGHPGHPVPRRVEDVYGELIRALLSGRHPKLEKELAARHTNFSALAEELVRLQRARQSITEGVNKIQRDWLAASLAAGPADPASLRERAVYPELREAYANAGVAIRFVGIGEIDKEPPCAGVERQSALPRTETNTETD